MSPPADKIAALPYFLLMLKASLISTGGMGNVPSLHADFLARRWASDRDFAQALTIGQLSPGPTGLWVVSFGYLTYGLTGALLASIAIVLPPLLILLIEALHARLEERPAAQGFVRGLGLAAVGTFGYVLCQLMQRNGVDLFTLSIALAACLLATRKQVPSIAIIGLAAAMGVLVR